MTHIDMSSIRDQQFLQTYALQQLSMYDRLHLLIIVVISTAGHLSAMNLAVESVVLTAAHGRVIRSLQLQYIAQDAMLHQLMAELALGQHDVLLRTDSMRTQAQVRVRLLWSPFACTCLTA